MYEQNMYDCSLCRTYQLFQPFYEPVVLDSVAPDNHSHTVTATGSKGMSMFVVCEDLSLVFHQGTTPAYALDQHAAENKKFRLRHCNMHVHVHLHVSDSIIIRLICTLHSCTIDCRKLISNTNTPSLPS